METAQSHLLVQARHAQHPRPLGVRRQARPGLDGPVCLKEEIMELQGQIVTLQSQVDILSKVFLFIDVEALCKKIETYSLQDSSEPATATIFHY